MKKFTKVLAPLSAVILTLTFASGASAYTYTTCKNEPANYNPTWHVLRNTSSYFAARGEVVIRQLHGCSGATGTQDNHAQVWPANMQGSLDFMQIGYGNVDGTTSMNWWASRYAGFSNDVSQMSLAFFPVVGDTVRFDISHVVVGGVDYWQLKVDDLSHAGWYGWRNLYQTDDHVGLVWYGLEDHNENSQFGGNSSANTVRIRGTAYKFSDAGAWQYLTGNSGSAGGYWAGTAGVTQPGCWVQGVTTYSGPFASNQTSLNGYTADNALGPLC